MPRTPPPRLCGPANPNWKGGTWINSGGYVMVLVGRDHPLANCRGYVQRCRLVCFEAHGMPEPGQHAHHINGDKQDDRPENLEWRWPDEHGRHHLTPERARQLGKKGARALARRRRREQRERELRSAAAKKGAQTKRRRMAA